MAQKMTNFMTGMEDATAASLKKRLHHQRSLMKYGMTQRRICFLIALTPVVTTVICILTVFLLVIAIVVKSCTLIVLSQRSMNKEIFKSLYHVLSIP